MTALFATARLCHSALLFDQFTMFDARLKGPAHSALAKKADRAWFSMGGASLL